MQIALQYINDKYAPAWKTIEFMTLGNLTSLYKAIKDDEVKRIIAKRYGCSIKVFLNYLETIRVIRNKCAHGNCIYNIQTAKGISIKPAGVTDDSRHNINGAICVIKYILGTISPERRKDLEKDIAGLMNAKREINATEIINSIFKNDKKSQNLSYPKAREIYISSILGKNYSTHIKLPNNILSVEYL